MDNKIYEEQYSKAKEDLRKGYQLQPKLTKEEFTKEADIKGQTLSSFRKQQVLPFLFFTGGTAFKTVKTFKPKVIPGSEKGGVVLKPTRIYEKSVPALTDEGYKVLGGFKQMNIVTAKSVLTQSPVAKVASKYLYGFGPKTVKLRSGQTYISQPWLNVYGIPIDAQKGYSLRIGRVGKKGDLVNIQTRTIEGINEPVKFKDIKHLGKAEQYTWWGTLDKYRAYKPAKIIKTRLPPKQFGQYLVKEGKLDKFWTNVRPSTMDMTLPKWAPKGS
ncbi:unnamed protein product, partial [marine sediment metagenome]